MGNRVFPRIIKMLRESRHPIAESECIQRRDSCAHFFAFSAFFSRGLQVEKGVRDAAMYLKIREVRL